jgi:hypothetical protein
MQELNLQTSETKGCVPSHQRGLRLCVHVFKDFCYCLSIYCKTNIFACQTVLDKLTRLLPCV